MYRPALKDLPCHCDSEADTGIIGCASIRAFIFKSTGDVHMIEADVLLRGGEGGNGEPIMAHPPETDSDNTLQEWLKEIVNTDKGIKLDFKRYLKTKRFLYSLGCD